MVKLQKKAGLAEEAAWTAFDVDPFGPDAKQGAHPSQAPLV